MPQARSNAKPCRKPRHSQAHYLRGALMMLYYIRNKHPGLADDEEGRVFLMVLLALGLPHDEVKNIASWITEPELRAIRRAAKRFKATSASIGVAIKLTDAEREKHGWRRKDGKCIRTSILLIRPYDVDWKVVLRRREIEKNTTRRIKRQEEKAALMTQVATYPPRQAAILTAIERVRQQPGCFTPFAQVIMQAMTKDECAAFPTNEESFRRIFYRTISTLEERGMVEKRVTARNDWGRGGFIWPVESSEKTVTSVTENRESGVTPAASVSRVRKPKQIKPLHGKKGVTSGDTDVVMVPPATALDEDASKKPSVTMEPATTAGPDRTSHRVEKRRLTLKQGQKMKMQMRQLRQSLADRKHQQVHDTDAVITKRQHRSNQ